MHEHVNNNKLPGNRRSKSKIENRKLKSKSKIKIENRKSKIAIINYDKHFYYVGITIYEFLLILVIVEFEHYL
jgi:hypothetical protein